MTNAMAAILTDREQISDIPFGKGTDDCCSWTCWRERGFDNLPPRMYRAAAEKAAAVASL